MAKPKFTLPPPGLDSPQLNRREAISKRRRFELFKRDGFACQYCGRRPPDVILEIDHIHPVAKGGTSDDANLCTSCEPCNSGKGAKRLSTRRPRPDADVAYLELQQEAAEHRRYIESLTLREDVTNDLINALGGLWEAITGRAGTKRIVFRKFLSRYAPDVVEIGIRISAEKAADGKLQWSEWVPYAWGVMRGVAATRERAERAN